MNRTPIVYVLLAWVALACWPSSAALGHLWSQVDNSHGFLIAALSVWLIFSSRAEIDRAPAKPSLLGFAGLLVAGLAWIVSWRAGLQALHLVLLPVLMGLTVYATFGFSVALRIAFPLAMLYFALPVWEIFTQPLQEMTVRVTDTLLQVARIPASIEGNHVHLTVGTFEIARGCSGLHFFIVGLALAAVVGELDRQSIVKRAVLIAIMALLAMISNWVRVFVIVLAGNYSDMKHYLVHNHYGFGWAVFAVAIMIFLFLVRRFFPAPPRAGATAEEGAAASAPRVQVLPVAAAALVVAVVLVGNLVPVLRERAQPAQLGMKLPSGKAPWRGPGTIAVTTWWPEFKGTPARAQAEYADAQNRRVEAFIVTYRVQRQGAELIGFDNSLTGPQIETLDTHEIETPAGRFIESTVYDSNGDQALIWYAYHIGERRLVEPLLSQLWYGATSIFAEQPASLFAFRAICSTDCKAARKTLGDFAASMTKPLLVAAQTAVPYAEAPAPKMPAPLTPSDRFNAAMKYLAGRQFSRAEFAFLATLHFDGDKLQPQQRALLTAGVVEARLAQNKIPAAKEAHAILASDFPAAAGTRLLGARIKLAEKDGEGAANELQTVTADYPDYLPARLLLGQLLIAQRKLYQAEAQLRATVAKFPHDKTARTLLLETQLRLAKPEDVRNPYLLNNMAWRYMQEGDDRAEVFARRAYDMEPTNAAIADTYGWIILKMKNDPARALPLLKAAAEGAPADAAIQLHHATAMAAANDSAGARAVLEKLLAGSADSPIRKEAENLLQKLSSGIR